MAFNNNDNDSKTPPPPTTVQPQVSFDRFAGSMRQHLPNEGSFPEAAKKPLNISSLMSPPELPPFETFAQSALSSTPGLVGTARRVSLDHPFVSHPLSPPISPFAKAPSCIDPVPTTRSGFQDPILYPTSDISPTPSQQPLFKAAETGGDDVEGQLVGDLESQRVVDEHLAARPASVFLPTEPPRREEYELALYFKACVMKSYSANPRSWLRKERAILEADRRANARPAAVAASSQPSSSPLLSSSSRPKYPAILPAKEKRPSASRVTKPGRQIMPSAKAAASRPRPRLSNTDLPSRAAPRRESAGRKKTSPTPDPQTPPRAVPARDDKKFEELPDYCPKLSTIPDKPGCLKAEWKGVPLDLSLDLYRHLLHPEELILASGLRLDCAMYLTAKRRIFIKRIECAHKGKEFRKTDAQQACKIDVNKASKLWASFDKIGWLDMKYIKDFM